MGKLQVEVGHVMVGYGLTNAGRYVTVLKVGATRGRVLVRRHIDNKEYWTFTTYYRLA